MSANNLYQALGWLVCAGSVLLIGLVVILARMVAGQRNRAAGPDNSVLHAPRYKDEAFTGIPSTGSTLESERTSPREQIIGSSGFDAQSHNSPSRSVKEESD